MTRGPHKLNSGVEAALPGDSPESVTSDRQKDHFGG
jgi:hypothetical protein